MNLTRFRQRLSAVQVDLSCLDLNRSASVLIAITDSKADPKIVLTQRAVNMNTHGGQVAFPGGRWEEGDQSLMHTALRLSLIHI